MSQPESAAKGTIANDPEIAALSKVLKILTALDAGQRWRIIRYLQEKFAAGEPVSADTMEK